MLVQTLLAIYSADGRERCGFILPSGELIEVQNIAINPAEAFCVSASDLEVYEPLAVGTFHTHPSESSNLSADDFHGFLDWPDWFHIIVGNDGISSYHVEGNKVIRDAS